MKFQSKAIAEHGEAPLADQGRLAAIMDSIVPRPVEPPERSEAPQLGEPCYLVPIVAQDESDAVRNARLAELRSLVEHGGDHVVGEVTLALRRPDPRTLIGKGKAAQIAESAQAHGARRLVFDATLTPSQMRNLEDASGLPVCDRESVILSVFERHARTRRARIQVELSQLLYARPRIRGLGLRMDKQAASLMKARGPGETAAELLARRIDHRLAELRRALAQLDRAAREQRKGRDECARIVLLGYTNAGKTSLMNALTGESLSARDRPFETLDTTSRCLSRDGQPIVISDTVGFIRDLPAHLLESFASTLSEVEGASLTVLVVDLSDPEAPQQLELCSRMARELSGPDTPQFLVFNKADRLTSELDWASLHGMAQGRPFQLLSTRDGAAVLRLRSALLDYLRPASAQQQLVVAYNEAEVMAAVYGSGCRIVSAKAEEAGMRFVLEGPVQALRAVKRLAGKEIS